MANGNSKASATVSQAEINGILWKACDTFRGAVDPSEYKNYILVMLFVKYISDVWQDHYAKLVEEYGDPKSKTAKERIERRLKRERFVLPAHCTFDSLYEQRNAANIGEVINTVLDEIEDSNKEKLEGVFRNIDFNSEASLGQTKERNNRLKSLLEDFSDPRLDLRPSRVGNMDVIGNAYEYLIGRFAAGAGKKAGEFYTPPEVSQLIARLVDPQPGDRICDPACGSGSLLIKCGNQVGSKDFSLWGQENIGATWALAKMNMFLHGMDNARIEWGDTIRTPKLLSDDRLMKFEVVVANPPFSLDKWGADEAGADHYNRFHRGIPPKSKGDFAFISHMIETITETSGRVGVVVPHGVLFRGSTEGKIRQQLIEENLLDAVIGLPPDLFYGTNIPATILLFRKAKPDSTIVFIDASRGFEATKSQNRLREQDIEKIIETVNARKNVDKYAYVADLSEVKQDDFNLNIPRYVDTFDEDKAVDSAKLQAEILEIDEELLRLQRRMNDTWGIIKANTSSVQSAPSKSHNALPVTQLRMMRDRFRVIPKSWQIVQIAKLVKRRSETSSDTDKFPLFSFTIEDGVTAKTDRYERSFLLTDKENNQYKVVYPGDFVLNPMNARFGAIDLSRQSKPVTVSGYYDVFFVREELVNKEFLALLLRTPELLDMYDRISLGSLVEKKRVHFAEFIKLCIPLPPMEMQIEIAESATILQSEIDLLNRKQGALSAQKKGLMQNLLSGNGTLDCCTESTKG